jgi:hypothetical protein
MTKCLTCGADAREGCGDPACPYDRSLPAFDGEGRGLAEQEKADADAEFAANTAREIVARWMMEHGYATGHGDSLCDLLHQLHLQHRERGIVRYAMVAALKEATNALAMMTAPDAIRATSVQHAWAQAVAAEATARAALAKAGVQ